MIEAFFPNLLIMLPEDRLSTYDYELPEELIASEPCQQREGSRLLVVDRARQKIRHDSFKRLPELLQAGDLLIVNETKVVPARIAGIRQATGGQWSGLFLRTDAEGNWRLIGQTRGKLQPGESILLRPIHERDHHSEFALRLIECHPGGEWLARPMEDSDPWTVLDHFGTVPLPPYIERELPTEQDRQRYQTTFARVPGAVAAPTAGLHFTPELLEQCSCRGIEHVPITLHVGLGTFRPVSSEDLSQHQMHAEWCEVPLDTAKRIQQVRQQGGRIVAVGTTTVRALESAARTGTIRSWSGETDIFIRPPYEFRAIDALITNFHLPKSTLLMLVSALAGRELMAQAYQEAIRQRYRFFSYGDAMLIL